VILALAIVLAGLFCLACGQGPASLALPSSSTDASPVDAPDTPADAGQPAAPDAAAPDAAAPDAAAPVVGFDRVVALLNKPEYGPCTRCHMKPDYWPHLDKDPVAAWPLFEASAKASKEADVKSTSDLARRVLACVDQSSTERCVDSHGDPNNDPDLKMPTRFGYVPVSADDVAIIRQWVSNGAQPSSR
jgi:hypothetical protein